MRSIFTPLCLSVLVAGCGNNAVKQMSTDMAVGTTTDLSNSDDLASGSVGPCDLIAQDCADPAAPKCQLVSDGTSAQTLTPTCEPGGTVALGQSCMRTDPMNITPDNCAKGLVCTRLGDAAGLITCHKFCKASTDCPMGQKCAEVQMGLTVGICVQTCALFSTGDCAAGKTCGDFLPTANGTKTTPPVPFCRTIGPKKTGDDCMAPTDCGVDSICLTSGMGPGTCSPLCDNATHGCPTLPGMGGADGGQTDGGIALMCMMIQGGINVCQ